MGPSPSDQPDGEQRLGRSIPGWTRWIGLPISAIAILFLASQVDLRAAAAVLSTAHLAPLVGATLLIGVQVALVTARWRLLLPRNESGHRPSYLGTARALLVGYLGNFVLPARLGEAVRAYLVSRLEGLSLTGSFASVILERVVDTASIALIATVLALGLGAPNWVVQITALVAAGALLAFVLVAFGLLEVVSAWLLRVVPSGWRVRMVALSTTLDDFSRGLSAGGRWRTILAVLGISLVSWMFEAGVYFLVAQSLGIEEILLPQALLIAAVTVLATAVPSAPAYVGTFELAATGVAIAMGVPEAEALAFAILVHVTTVIPLAVGGVISLSTIGMGLVPLARMAGKSGGSADG
jgi:hypothetical protein